MENKIEIKARTEIVIDFKAGNFKGYVLIERKFALQNKKIDAQKQKECSKYSHFLSKQFCVSNDYKTVTIDNNIYEIPDFFNKQMLKSNDIKTWQMVFYYFFYDEFGQEANKYQTIIDNKSYIIDSPNMQYKLNPNSNYVQKNIKKEEIKWLNCFGLDFKVGILTATKNRKD